ncbi:hypothetical protein DRN67_01305, partial [Candidatus Micrarchaeota archaeon]
RTVRTFRTQLYEGRMALATSLPGGELVDPNVVWDTSVGEVRRERRINQILSAIPVLGLIDHKDAIAEGTFDNYYSDYITNTLVPNVNNLTEWYSSEVRSSIFDLGAGAEGPFAREGHGVYLNNPRTLDFLAENYYSALIAYSIVKRVADREGLTGENAPPELATAGQAITDFETVAAEGLNEMFRARGMRFYEGELERYDVGENSPAPYLEVALGRFSEDLASMERWLANAEERIVLHGENFASMASIYTLWSQDDIGALVDAVNDGRIQFRSIDGSWLPREVVVEKLRQFNVSNAFGTDWSVLPDEATYNEYLHWVQENRQTQ